MFVDLFVEDMVLSCSCVKDLLPFIKSTRKNQDNSRQTQRICWSKIDKGEYENYVQELLQDANPAIETKEDLTRTVLQVNSVMKVVVCKIVIHCRNLPLCLLICL
jgi:hypothetical protein